jgi:di/tricarboxylate transporter
MMQASSEKWDISPPTDLDICPCRHPFRRLEEEEEDYILWHTIFTGIVLFIMFAVLLVDKIGADSAMLMALTAFMASDIITIKEGLAGFSNEGLMTVMILFVVAEGISKTGALDWYMGKVLGRPTTAASAQLRMMLPVASVSAFLNNTPIVAVMIPIVVKWARNCNIPIQQLMMPLSYATILGGTCTLIGTSTNLVVSGLIEERYPDDPEMQIGLFSLGLYGVPCAIVGIAYMVVGSPYLLPFGSRRRGADNDTAPLSNGEDVLLGARLSPWSPAAGRSVKRSGLRDAGGIYLVSVYRASTGNIHRAVGQEFVLNAGDILYFTGLVEGFGEFCNEHGLEILTTENDNENNANAKLLSSSNEKADNSGNEAVPVEIGVTKDSLLNASDAERSRAVARLTDLIRGFQREEPVGEEQLVASQKNIAPTAAHKVVAVQEHDLVVIGVDVRDRPGLLLEISKALASLRLNIRHTEASVVGQRSISIWRCELIDSDIVDLDAIWSVLNALLEIESGSFAVKERGLQVIRAIVPKVSSLVGKSASEVDFRRSYRAGVVAIQQGGKNVPVASVVFGPGDILVLQVTNDSPLLKVPPDDFYKDLNSKNPPTNLHDDTETGNTKSDEHAWKDLHVLSFNNGEATGDVGKAREFLAAMQVAPRSSLPTKTAFDLGFTKLPGVFLVSVDRPTSQKERAVVTKPGQDADDRSDSRSLATVDHPFTSITIEQPLEVGDILWFAGSAGDLGDLRKIPGLISYESDEVKKINEKAFDRRLVEAVVARRGPLVGKTVRELQFRTKFGAAVIAVHRDGNRIHEHPGKIKLQAGDVLLLEAGPTFIKKSVENTRSFALLAEVEDSAPPRMHLLIPAIILVIAMLVIASLEYESLLVCALIVAMLMSLMGLISEQEARDAAKWDIFVTIGSAFGIGTALVNSGLASAIAGVLVDLGEAIGIGDAGLIGAVYLGTTLISLLVTNNAAAALMFPVAIDAAERAGTDLLTMCFTLMLGASDYASPFGYQTNLMVYGPGGYKTMDYVSFGGPMQVVLWLMSTCVLSAKPENWWLGWVGAFAALALVAITHVPNPLTALFTKKESTDSK